MLIRLPRAGSLAPERRRQMLQLSYDGVRLYVTNSLYSTRDNQLYPELRAWLLRIRSDPDGMEIHQNFFVDIHDRPGGPARAHEAPAGRRLYDRDLPVDR